MTEPVQFMSQHTAVEYKVPEPSALQRPLRASELATGAHHRPQVPGVRQGLHAAARLLPAVRRRDDRGRRGRRRRPRHDHDVLGDHAAAVPGPEGDRGLRAGARSCSTGPTPTIMVQRIDGIPIADMRTGMRVEAVWPPEAERKLTRRRVGATAAWASATRSRAGNRPASPTAPVEQIRGAHSSDRRELGICMRDVAIVSFAQAPLDQPPGQTETLMLLPTITEALAAVGMTRRDVEFTCSGSADYLTGGTFTFVQMLEAAGAWPPISESHVEMDGAWALYEAWVRLQHGDVDVALVFSSGRASLGVSLRETLTLPARPVLPRAARRRLRVARRAAGAGRARHDRPHRERTSPRSSRERRRDASGNPNAAVSGDSSVDDLLAEGLRGRAAARARHRPAGRRRGRGRARRR